ncbi:hypothetical protein CS022_19930 [Veronia nyctiphanis]|uniref:Outer membrane protein beta-barrel domain-containing protein n=1 Tax=Veronia nyctiphanis TaxID=1278244 RepID=A0A4Q0YRJ2_9GAMM|nr:outer membrane beta-barrel protein [Veronia nyctiphanis]RXJ71719.1 hypothetical protein CS022_19930 [Veronia nyctiphanis]
MDLKINGQPLDEDGIFDGEIYYRRMLFENFGIEGGWRQSFEVPIFTAVESILGADIKGVENGGPRLSAYGAYPMGGGFSLYGKGGLTYYKLEYSFKDQQQDKSSLGGEVAAGLNWDLGYVGLNLEANYARSSKVSTTTGRLGLHMNF